LKKVGQLF